MSRYLGLHTLPGFSKDMLAQATPALEQLAAQTGSPTVFIRAYSGFREGKVVCEFEAPSKNALADVYGKLGFPYDEIVEVEAICETGEAGVATRDV